MTTPDETDELLAQARRAFTPGRTQSERVHAAVLAAVAVPDPLGDGGTSAANGAGAAGGTMAPMQGLGAWGGKTWFLAALTLGAASGAGLWASGAFEPAPRIASPTSGKEAPLRTQPAVLSDELPKPASPSLAQAVPAASAAPPVAARETTATGRAPATPPRASDGSGASALALRDELKGVREAERALNSGEPGRALALLEGLERSPGGSLREERAALRVLANCHLATSASADHARRFLSTYPSSFYAPRIRAKCP